MNITAKDTEYNGLLFRSRLEARWAVFFDELGIKYRYEPEDFVGGNGERYLPDFYFPDIEMYGEVKGKPFTEKEKSKMAGCVKNGQLEGGLIFFGNIPQGTHLQEFSVLSLKAIYNPTLFEEELWPGEVIITHRGTTKTNFFFENGFGEVCLNSFGGMPVAGYLSRKEFKGIGMREFPFDDAELLEPRWCPPVFWWDDDTADAVNAALDRARKARFEFL